MEYKDYYETLGLSRDASNDDIRRSYKKLARKYHPDVSKEADAEDQFKAVGEAYEVLKDPEKREAYDQLGANWKNGQQGFEPPPEWEQQFDFGGRGGGFSQGGTHDFSSFFDDLFGGARSQGGRYYQGGGAGGFQSKGKDIRAKVKIDLEDTINGATRSFSLNIPETDQTGRTVAKSRTLKVKIPKGVKDGQTIRLSKQGSLGIAGGEAGDLLLEVGFNTHRLYTVEGKDIYLNLPIAPWEATLGAKVSVPTPFGNVEMKIPEDSQQGRKLRLKGRGLPGKDAGNFYVVLQITLPPVSDTAVKAFNEKMRDELDFDPRRNMFQTVV